VGGWVSSQVALIQAGTTKIDEELKTLAVAFTEKQQSVAALKRKKQGSLLAATLEEVLSEETISGIEFLDTEFLITLVAVVPKGSEQGKEEGERLGIGS